MSEYLSHAEEAERLIDMANGKHVDKAAVIIATAQVQATLALVEQQKAANLIALSQVRALRSDVPPFRHLAMEALDEYSLRPSEALREALGL